MLNVSQDYNEIYIAIEVFSFFFPIFSLSVAGTAAADFKPHHFSVQQRKLHFAERSLNRFQPRSLIKHNQTTLSVVV